MAGTPTQPACPGGGGTSTTSLHTGGSFNASVGWSGAQVSGEVHADADAGIHCPTNDISTIIVKNKSNNLTQIDNSVMMMNKSNLSSMSESVNQMVVNSITSTTTSSSQSVNINQQINIQVNGVKGNVTIDNMNQVATIDLSNSVNMEMNAIDNVRTDLANQVLEQFSNNTNADQMSQASANISNQIENQTAQAVTAKDSMDVDQSVSSATVPASQPTNVTPPDPKSNINSAQDIENSISSTLIHNSPFSLTNDITQSIANSVKNSVTQNFSHNTVTQLMQAINLNQSMNIDVQSVGGNVVISNLSQMANVQLRQVMSANMNIGSAIVNGVADGVGIKTDASTAVSKTDLTTAASTTGLRNSNSYTADLTSDTKLSQKMVTTSSLDMGLGSMGMIIALCLCCCCSVVLLPMLGGGLPSGGGDEEESSSDDSSSSSSSASSSSASSASSVLSALGNKGGDSSDYSDYF
jgi:hypothetical protein